MQICTPGPILELLEAHMRAQSPTRRALVPSSVFVLAALACGGPPPVDDDPRASLDDDEADEDADGPGGIPDGVIDDDIVGEDSDADGYCFSAEGGYFPCDDGAPPGSGPPGGGGNTGGDGDGDGPGGVGDGPGDGPGNGGGNTGGDGDGDGPGGVGDGPGGGEVPVVCTAQTWTAEDAPPPRILLVVDKSGSMEDAATGYAGTKWDGAVDALSSVVDGLDADVEFGLMLFPDGDANNDVCREGALEVSVGLNKGAAIVDRLDATSPGGGTPTAPTLLEAGQVLAGLGGDGAKAVILATDGAPNCNAGLNVNTCTCTVTGGCDDSLLCLDDAATVSAASTLNAGGTSVFVVGIPGSENFTSVLDAVADAGGTAQPGATGYYEAGDDDALAAAIEEIAARLTTCRFDLAGPPTDPGAMIVEVGVTDFARDVNRLSGWDLVDDDTLELFGTPCALATNGLPVTVTYCAPIPSDG